MIDQRRGQCCLLLLMLLTLACSCLADPSVWPTWRATTWEGKDFHSRKLDGQVVVVAIWASWCPASRRQLPILNSMQHHYRKDGFRVVSFSFDHTEKSHQKYVSEHDLMFPAIFARTGDGLEAVRSIQSNAGTLEAVPTVLVYDRNGHLAHRLVGYFNRRQLDDLIMPLLQK